MVVLQNWISFRCSKPSFLLPRWSGGRLGLRTHHGRRISALSVANKSARISPTRCEPRQWSQLHFTEFLGKIVLPGVLPFLERELCKRKAQLQIIWLFFKVVNHELVANNNGEWLIGNFSNISLYGLLRVVISSRADIYVSFKERNLKEVQVKRKKFRYEIRESAFGALFCTILLGNVKELRTRKGMRWVVFDPISNFSFLYDGLALAMKFFSFACFQFLFFCIFDLSSDSKILAVSWKIYLI